MIYIIYHSADLDGHLSGYLIRLWLECSRNAEINKDFKMIGLDYGQPFDETKIEDGSEVFMADFSIQPYDRMTTLNKRCKLILWDHHRSAFEAVKDIPGFHEDDDISGCRIVYSQLFSKEIPKWISLLSDYDCWINTDKEYWENEVMPFQLGMRSFPTDPSTDDGIETWNNFFKRDAAPGLVTHISLIGNGIRRYQSIVDAKDMERSFEMVFEGYRCLCINGGKGSNQFNSAYDPEKHDVTLVYQQVKNKYWTISLYTQKDIDVSLIASKWGGGGHKKACGFQVKDIQKVIGKFDA